MRADPDATATRVSSPTMGPGDPACRRRPRRVGVIAWLAVLLTASASAGRPVLGPLALAEAPRAYRTPYRVEFTVPRGELVGDVERTERGDPRLEAEVSHEHWYSPATLRRWHGWGPPARSYPPP